MSADDQRALKRISAIRLALTGILLIVNFVMLAMTPLTMRDTAAFGLCALFLGVTEIQDAFTLPNIRKDDLAPIKLLGTCLLRLIVISIMAVILLPAGKDVVLAYLAAISALLCISTTWAVKLWDLLGGTS